LPIVSCGSSAGAVATTAAILSTVVLLATPGSAFAVPPTFSAVSQQDRHPVAKFSAPRADFVAIYFASKPDRATDGSFLQENIVSVDILTDSEIQAGRWSGETQLNPGSYWVMLSASPDFGLCFRDDGTIDPACADGFSNVVTLVVPKPTVRYAARVTVYRYLREASLRLIATPLGEKRSYRLCYKTKHGRTPCLGGTLDGFDWNSPADDTLTVSTRNLPTLATFSWYVSGARVATKRIRVR
jgi:hypothetical protein